MQLRAGAYSYDSNGDPATHIDDDQRDHYTSVDYVLSSADYQPGDIWSIVINDTTIQYPGEGDSHLPKDIRGLADELAKKITSTFNDKYYDGETAVKASLTGTTGANIRIEVPSNGQASPTAATSDAFTIEEVSRGGGQVKALFDIDHTCLLYTSPSPRDRG